MVTTSRLGVTPSPGYSLDPVGRRTTWDKTYLGIVKNTKDAQFMGRLLVWIPELCGAEEDETTWIPVDYASPFGGATSINNVTSNRDSGQISYGMWFVPPDVDNQVLCMFVNGDPLRGIWFACLFQVGRHKMVPAYPGNSASTKEENPLVIADSASTLAIGTLSTSQNILGLTPQGSGQVPPRSTSGTQTFQQAVGTSEPAAPSPSGGPIPEVSASQTNSRTAGIPIIGPSSWSSHNSYSVNGIATPGGNRLVMSDQTSDTQIRIQTRNNMQLLLHNDRDMAVLMTGDGRSRIELNGNGDIDIYGDGKVSLAAEGDLNLHSTSGDVNINAGGNLNVRSNGDSKFTSGGRMHLYSKSNLMMTSEGDTHRSSNGSMFDTSAQKMHRQSNFGIYDSTNAGDINQWAWGNILLRSTETFNVLSTGTAKIQSGGVLSIKSGSDLNLQSAANLNVLAGNSLFLDAVQQGNLRAQGGSLNLQSMNADLNLNGGPRVVIGPTTVINAGVVPSANGAGSAENAASASESLFATAASQVSVTQHLVAYVGNKLGGGLSARVISSVSSRVPSGEPAPNRFVASPGYSNTNTVERSDVVASDFKIGQIELGQSVPLQCLGWIDSGSIITVGSANLNNFAAPITPGGGERKNGILLGIPPEGRGLLDAIAKPESGGRYNIIYGGTPFFDYKDHPRVAVPIGSGPNTGRTSSAAGRYQFIGSTWDGLASQYGLRDFGPVNQDLAAWYLAQRDYRSRTGRDLYSDLQAGQLDSVSRNLSPTWTSLSGGIEAQSSGSGSSFASTYAQGVAAANAGVTANNAPASPRTPEEAPVTNALPQRYFGIGYRDTQPIYVKDVTPNWVFKNATELTLSSVGLTDIQNFETNQGVKPSDQPGQKFRNVCNTADMIGFGHALKEGETTVVINNQSVNVDQGLTDEQALSLLKQDIKPFESLVQTSITNPITQEQFDALVDFAWNIGIERFKSSRVVTLINEKKYDSVPVEMIKWVVACGLVRAELASRRRANAMRFAGLLRAETPAVITGGSGEPVGQPFEANKYPWLRFSEGPQGVINNPRNPDALSKTSPRILELANRMGEILQTKLLINSAYRSKEYEEWRTGVPYTGNTTSGHFVGLGLDISETGVQGGKERLAVVAKSLGFTVRDNYSNRIHVQIGSGPAQA